MECNYQFNKVFTLSSGLIKNIATRFSKASGVPRDELISHLNEELWVAYEKFDGTKGASWQTWLNTRLRDRAKRVVTRKEGTYHRRVRAFDPLPGGDEDEPTPFSTLRCESTPDEIIRQQIKKKKTDQLGSLTDFLLESSQILSDPTMTAIIEGVKNGLTPYAIGKSLGLERNTVDRIIRRLARHYDREIYGDISDYLPDSLRIKRKYLTA